MSLPGVLSLNPKKSFKALTKFIKGSVGVGPPPDAPDSGIDNLKAANEAEQLRRRRARAAGGRASTILTGPGATLGGTVNRPTVLGG